MPEYKPDDDRPDYIYEYHRPSDTYHVLYRSTEEGHTTNVATVNTERKARLLVAAEDMLEELEWLADVVESPIAIKRISAILEYIEGP